jgi:hypothetical protein
MADGYALRCSDKKPFNKYRNIKSSDPVPTDPPTNPVEQPIDLFFNGPAYRTFLHVGITARPVAPLVSSLFNRPQGIITPAALRGGFDLF